MGATFLELYLKLNLLIAVALVLWLVTKQLARLLRFEVSHAQQLKVARRMFAGLLLAVPLLMLVKMLMPEWIKGVVTAVSGTGIQEFTITAGVNATVGKYYQFINSGFDQTLLIPVLLTSGLLMQLVRLAMQIGRLKLIIAEATEWKCIHGIHLLVSSSITSPFSTRAFGHKQIVLPAQLLESPRNLQLAIKHELQHARNGDLEWAILLEAIKALCCWNPAAWLWHNEFDCLQEFACDEVLVNERRVSSQAYGNCLLDVASVVIGGALLASSNMVPKFSFWQDHKSQLRKRILMLMRVSNKKHVGWKTLCYSLLIAFGLADTAVMVFAADTDEAEAEIRTTLKQVQVKSGLSDAQMNQFFTNIQTKAAPIKLDVAPLVRVNPEYPQRALAQGLEGQVTLQFTINETGSVQDLMALNSCVWSHPGSFPDCKDDDIFKETALAAVQHWKYAPERKDGKAIKRKNVQTMLRFQLD